MIHLPERASLTPAERFALDVLVDHACLLPVRTASSQVVSLAVSDDAASVSLASLAGEPPCRFEDGRVELSRGLLRAIAAVAGAEAEQLSDAADKVGRVPGAVNDMRRAGLDHQPLVSLVAMQLRQAVTRAAGERPFASLQPWPGGARWAAALSHDLDVVQWWPVFTGLRLVELGKKREWSRLRDVLRAAPGALAQDPVNAGIQRLLALEQRSGVRATWFIICGSPSIRSFLRGDVTYDPEAPLVQRTIAALADAGHELGLHGSFATMTDADAFRRERVHLGELGGRVIGGVRQHFLRMRPGSTHRAMEQAGFAYDATFGFPDGNGFRLGIADIVKAWDATAGREGELDLVPLVWMDRALSKYRGVEDPGTLIDDALDLARSCAAVNGLWVGLWHPNLTLPLGFPGCEDAFASLVRSLREMQPHIAPLGELVAWRRARREARAITVGADGRPAWGGAHGAVRPPLEDRAGRAVEWA